MNEFPLTWPDNWPRTPTKTTSQFKTSLAGALKNVQEEIVRFGKDSGKKIDSVLISSNVTLGQQSPVDSGVAVYFTWDGISTCIAVDRYAKVQDNLQAIYHCLDAERTKLRHGGLNLVRAAFRGYAALPPPSSNHKTWWVVLGVQQTSNIGEIEMAYKLLSKQAQGNHETQTELNLAIEQARMLKGIKKNGR